MIQQRHLMQFLKGSNESYNAIRGNILMMQPLPSMNQIYNILLQEEKQREIYNPSGIVGDLAALISHN